MSGRSEKLAADDLAVRQEVRRLAADYREARRYVRTDVRRTRPTLDVLSARLCDLADALYRIGDDHGRFSVERIVRNIAVGQRFILVDPEVLEGYLYAAAFELDEIASRGRGVSFE